MTRYASLKLTAWMTQSIKKALSGLPERGACGQRVSKGRTTPSSLKAESGRDQRYGRRVSPRPGIASARSPEYVSRSKTKAAVDRSGCGSMSNYKLLASPQKSSPRHVPRLPRNGPVVYPAQRATSWSEIRNSEQNSCRSQRDGRQGKGGAANVPGCQSTGTRHGCLQTSVRLPEQVSH